MRDGSLQSKAYAMVDSTNPGRRNGGDWERGSIVTLEKSGLEVGRPYFVMSKREEESGGVVEVCFQVMDEKVEQVIDVTVNTTKLQSGVMRF